MAMPYVIMREIGGYLAYPYRRVEQQRRYGRLAHGVGRNMGRATDEPPRVIRQANQIFAAPGKALWSAPPRASSRWRQPWGGRGQAEVFGSPEYAVEE